MKLFVLENVDKHTNLIVSALTATPEVCEKEINVYLKSSLKGTGCIIQQ